MTVEASVSEICSNQQGTISLLHCDARIDNRQQLIYALKLSKFASNEAIVVAAYEKWQTDFVKHLVGDFALVLFDHRHHAHLLARDPMGCRPLFYFHRHATFAFAETLPQLLSQLDTVPSTNLQWVADYLTHSVIMTTPYSDTTYYHDIYRVTPGHCCVIAADKRHSRQFWDIDTDTEIHYSNEQDYIDEFNERLHRAVYRRVQLADRVGSELSGGLDSSSVAVIAKRYQPELQGFSNTPNAADPDKEKTDEKPYAQSVADHAGIAMHWIDDVVDADIESLIIRANQACAMPCEGAYPIFAAPLYRCAQQHDVSVLLSGFGGDQGVNVQGVSVLRDMLRQHRWLDYWREQRAANKTHLKAYKATLLGMLRQYLPVVGRLREPQKKMAVDLMDFALSQSLMDKVSLPTTFPLLATIRQKQALPMRDMQRSLFVGDASWHVRVRIECSALVAKQYGIQYSYPLLDTELLQYCISLPGHIKYQRGIKRYLIRQAMQGLLPESVLTRFDKTGGTVPGVYFRFEDYARSQGAVTTAFASSSERLAAWEGIDKRQWQFVKMLQLMQQS